MGAESIISKLPKSVNLSDYTCWVWVGGDNVIRESGNFHPYLTSLSHGKAYNPWNIHGGSLGKADPSILEFTVVKHEDLQASTKYVLNLRYTSPQHNNQSILKKLIPAVVTL